MQTENTPLAGTEKISLPPHLRKPRLRRPEVVEYLELKHGITISAATLAKYAVKGVGGGPPYNLSVRTPLYPVAELDLWAHERLGGLRRTTSEG